MDKKPNVGVIVARFQVHELHRAHINLINTVIDEHQKVIIFLGVNAIKASFNNPLDYMSREKMIKDLYPDVIVLPIEDCRDDKDWSKQLDEKIYSMLTPCDMPLLYGGRDSFLRHYYGNFSTKEITDRQEIIYSGTKSREEISSKVKSSADFRAGVIYGVLNQYPKIISTVDIAIFDRKSNILLARKPKETLYRFVGGFTDISGESHEADAVREVFEETGLKFETSEMQYITSETINDWRYSSERDKIRTILFKTYINSDMSPIPNDDIEELRWFDFKDPSLTVNIIDEHKKLFYKLK